MSRPGAPRETHGPKLVVDVGASSRPVPATDTTPGRLAGYVAVELPALPAAATITAPRSCADWTESASACDGVVPTRLRLMTFAPRSLAQLIASTTSA